MMKLYNIEHSTSFKPEAHAGLWFDRFCPQAEVGNFKTNKKDTDKPNWLEALESNKVVGDSLKIEAFRDRQDTMVRAIGGKALAFKAEWHFVSGIGNPHPLENGFSWHPTLGVPYLTGAAVKGLLRSTLELAFDEEESDHDKQSLLFSWFGGKKPSSDPEEHAAGQLIFFDAIPFVPPTIGLDVMTPHMAKWYLEGGIRPNEPDTTPADWHDPVPIQYLVAKQMTLVISFAPREPTTTDLEEVSTVIEHALHYEGAGAKNRVGYGFFGRDTHTEEMWQRKYNEELRKYNEQLKVDTQTKDMSDVEKIIYHHTRQYGLPDVINALEDDRLFSEAEKTEAATIIKENLLLEKAWNVQSHKKFIKNKPYLRVQIVKKYLPK